MKCVSYTRTLPWKNHQGKLTIAEQNQRIAAYLAEHKELDLQKKYSDRKNDEKARTAFDQMTNGQRGLSTERKNPLWKLQTCYGTQFQTGFSNMLVQRRAGTFEADKMHI